MILTSVQKTAALGSKAIGLFSTFRIVFPNFPAWILVSSDKLLMNRKNLVVEEVALFKKVLFFFLETYGKDWEDSMCKGGTPDSRCWQFSSTLAYFRRFSRFRFT
jgi:hypothetical protein